MMYICSECIIVVYGSYELSFSLWFIIAAYDQEIEKDLSKKWNRLKKKWVNVSQGWSWC